MQGQLELYVVVEESRQKLAKATIEEAEKLRTLLKSVGFVVARRIGNGRSEEPNGGTQDKKKLSEHSNPSSEKSSTRDDGPNLLLISCHFQVLNRLSAGI